MRQVLLNQVGVNCVWFSCVLGAAFGAAWIGVVVSGAWIAVHLGGRPAPARELQLLLGAALVGALADLVLIHVGGLVYVGASPDAWFGPVWIVALWMGFATSLNVSFVWLRGRPLAAAAFGAVGGPLAYLAGRGLGAVAFGPPDMLPLLVLAGVWGAAMPLLVALAARLDPPAPAGSAILPS